jgi:hypothetical protein
MRKPDKLYRHLVTNPSAVISYRDFESLFRAFGFTPRPGKGSHTNWTHPKIAAVLTSQPKGKDAAPYQVRRLLAVIEEYDLHMTS